MCNLNSQMCPASKNRAPIHHESAKSLIKAWSASYLFSCHGYYDVFFVGENVLRGFGSGQSDVRSGTSNEVLRGEREYGLRGSG